MPKRKKFVKITCETKDVIVTAIAQDINELAMKRRCVKAAADFTEFEGKFEATVIVEDTAELQEAGTDLNIKLKNFKEDPYFDKESKEVRVY